MPPRSPKRASPEFKAFGGPHLTGGRSTLTGPGCSERYTASSTHWLGTCWDVPRCPFSCLRPPGLKPGGYPCLQECILSFSNASLHPFPSPLLTDNKTEAGSDPSLSGPDTSANPAVLSPFPPDHPLLRLHQTALFLWLEGRCEPTPLGVQVCTTP